MRRTVNDVHICCLFGREEHSAYAMSFLTAVPEPILPISWLSLSDGQSRWDLCSKCAKNSLPVELAAIVFR